MDYHNDRFQDHSLMIYKDKTLIALLPANIVEDKLYAHQGLSYGTFIVKNTIRFQDYNDAFICVLKYLEKNEIHQLLIRELPVIYTKHLSGELDYILSLLESKPVTINNYYVIDNLKSYTPNRNRKRALKVAKQNNVQITTDGIDYFWETILIKNLKHKFGVNPVHSLDEIKLLMKRFPDNIKYYSALVNDEIKAGVVMFITDKVAHFQYSSGDDERKETGALDFLFDYLVNTYKTKKFVSFGSSVTDNTLKIDMGLAYWKESFGAKLIPQRTFQINPKNHFKLNAIFK